MKIVTTLAAIFVCVIFFDFCVGKIFDRLLEKLPCEGERVAKSNYVLTRVNSDIVIVGSSRAECHYDSKLIQDSGLGGAVFNCGVDGSLFYYQVAVINCILDRYAPKLIIWDLQLEDLAKNILKENLGLLYPYYWGNSYIKGYLNELDTELKYKIWLNAYRYNATGSRILRSLRLSESNNLGFDGHEASDVSRSIEPMIVKLDKKPLDEKKIALLKQIIIRIQKNGSRLIIVHSPYFYQFNGSSSTTDILYSICRDYNILFINDSQLPEFIGNIDYVFDASHLNIKGANAFTELLSHQIN